MTRQCNTVSNFTGIDSVKVTNMRLVQFIKAINYLPKRKNFSQEVDFYILTFIKLIYMNAKIFLSEKWLQKIKTILIFTPVGSIFLFGCASLDNTKQLPNELHNTLKIFAEKHQVCGVAIAVVKNRQVDSTESATGCMPALTVNSDSVFQVASLSKTVFAYAVLKMVDQGKLEIDAPVMKYLPHGYRHQFNPLKTDPSNWVSDARIHEITVRMVLNHTSGLPNWASGPLIFNSAPGEKWEYSGESFVLLQRAVEVITGQPLDQFMENQVFKPLAMNHSSYIWTEKMAQTMLPGTKANGTARTTLTLKKPVAAFTLHTTAADYGKFIAALLENKIMLKQITASPVTADSSLNLQWGLGWGIENTPNDLYIWHWGNNIGYRAFVIASVHTGDGLVMLTNSENGLELAKPLTDKILPDKHTLFDSSMLGHDMVNWLCTKLRVCL